MSNVPKLRFKEFSGEWEEKKLGDFLILSLREIPTPQDNYLSIGIRSHGKGTFQKPDSDPKKISMNKLYQVHENDLIVSITFAWEGAIAIVKKEDENGLVSHRFPTYLFNEKLATHKFFKYVITKKSFRLMLELISPGGAGRNRVMSKKDFLNLTWLMPSLEEQTKIASFLTSVDTKIEQLTKKETLLKEYKKGVMQKIFSQKLRFKADGGRGHPELDSGSQMLNQVQHDGIKSEYPEWEEKKLGELLDYIQPTKYLVESTKYDDSYKTPVLTAGKTFILGYTNETSGIFKENLPVIIFDDFTTATKFVDFQFKAKSSAMKILIPNYNTNIKFVYEAMQIMRYEIGGHERHWISKYSQLYISTPSFDEQTKIANFLTSIDTKIDLVAKQLEEVKQFKKGLLQQMFV